MKKEKIFVSASVLKWARKTLFGGNLAEPASRLKISKEDLSTWESEGAEVTISQLKKISKIFKRHVSVLLLENPPVSQEPPKFRQLPNITNEILDKKTFLAIRQAQETQNTTSYIREGQINEFIKKIAKFSTNSDLLSSKIEEYLGVSSGLRFKSRNSREQLNIWKRLLGSVGIIVLELSFSLNDSRAFAIHDSVAPIIVLNSKDTDNARNFSLFHELGHLALGQTDIDKDLNLGISRNNADEYFCNKFSASFLVPKNLLNDSFNANSSIEDENIKKLANKFKVSMGVIWRRLRDIGSIDQDQIIKVKEKLSNFEPFTQDNSKNKFRANKNTYLYTTIKRKSELYISEVFDAFTRNKITYYDMVDYIGIKADSLPKLQRLMFT